MKQAIRALSLAAKILWVIVIIFSVTAVYSAANLRISFGEPETYLSEDSLTWSTPFFINNTGFYEIANLNITTHIKDLYDKTVSTSTTIVPTIPPSRSIQETHNITLNLKNLIGELSYLAFNDSVFNIHTFVALRFANVIPIQVLTNTTIPWGAPLYNFTIGEITLNHAEMRLTIPLSFENHAFFGFNGTIYIEAYNSENEQISATDVIIEVLPGSGFEDLVEMNVDVRKLTSEGHLRISLETSIFNVGPIIKSW